MNDSGSNLFGIGAEVNHKAPNSTFTKAFHWFHLARRADFDLKRFTKLSGVSPKQLERLCQRDLGRTPGEWVAQQRLMAASWLLREKPVKAVAYELGFKQVSHFCRRFKRLFGITATEYQELYAEKYSNVGNG